MDSAANQTLAPDGSLRNPPVKCISGQTFFWSR